MKKIATNFHVIRVVLSCFFCGLYSRAVNNVAEQGWWNWGGQRTPQFFYLPPTLQNEWKLSFGGEKTSLNPLPSEL